MENDEKGGIVQWDTIHSLLDEMRKMEDMSPRTQFYQKKKKKKKSVAAFIRSNGMFNIPKHEQWKSTMCCTFQGMILSQ